MLITGHSWLSLPVRSRLEQVKLIDFHVGRTILQHSLIVMGVLVGIFLFLTFIDQLSDLGTGTYGLLAVLRFVVLSTPGIVYQIFPMAALVGTILGLSVLARHSELVVMRASGVSLAQITGSVLKLGVLFVLSAVLVGELVSPWTETMAQRGRAEALERNIEQKHSSGLWMRDQSTYVNIGEVLPDLTLRRVKIFEFDRQDRDRLRSLVYAASGRYTDARWRLSRVRKTIIDGQGFATATQGDEVNWDTGVTPEMMSVFLVQPGQLPVWQLKKYIEHLLKNNQDTRTYELAYWGKLVLPLSTAVMVILAIPFVFGSLRSGSLGRHLFFGIMIGLGFFVFNKALGYIVLVYGVPPLIGAISPTIAFLCATIVLYRRVA